MIELKELHIKKVLEKNPDTDSYEWKKVVKISIEDKTRSFEVTFPEDVVKRILEPVIDVIVDAIDIEKQQLKNDLISLVKGATDEQGDRS